MRLPLLLTGLFVIGGCTISPTTFNFATPLESTSRVITIDKDVRWQESEEAPNTTSSSDTKPAVQPESEPIPQRPPIPSLPTFTDEELNDPDIIESRLVDHIEELRIHISDYYKELDEFESDAFDTRPDR